jgi:CRP/FNR family transcriptional regulator
MACRQPVMGALDACLRNHWLFAGADDAFVRSYGGRFYQRTVPATTIVYDQGDAAETIYLVRSGKVRVGHLTPFGNDVTTAIVGCDQLLGEETVFAAGAPRTAQAMALTDSVLYIIPRATFAKMLSRNAAVAFNVAVYVQAQRDDALATAVNLVSLKVPVRIRRLLHRLASEHGVADASGTRIEVPLTHYDIASLVGSTRETVSVEIGRLLRSGRLIRRNGFFTVRASFF